MRTSTSLSFAVLATSVAAFPALGAQKRNLAVGDWAPAGPDDIRGPCPGLNTLANHGYLARNGQNIRAIDIITAMEAHLGIKADFGFLQTLVAGLRNAFVFLPNGEVGMTSLDVLSNSHNAIEHDGSFTRNDAYFDLVAAGVDPSSMSSGEASTAMPPQHNPKQNITQIEWLFSHSKDGVVLTVDDIADARHSRLQDSFSRNPTVTLEKQQTDAMWREGALISLAVGDASGAVRVDWLREWWENERLPTALGWSPRVPSAGLIDNIHWTNVYMAAEKTRNGNDNGTPELPLQFGIPI